VSTDPGSVFIDPIVLCPLARFCVHGPSFYSWSRLCVHGSEFCIHESWFFAYGSWSCVRGDSGSMFTDPWFGIQDSVSVRWSDYVLTGPNSVFTAPVFAFINLHFVWPAPWFLFLVSCSELDSFSRSSVLFHGPWFFSWFISRSYVLYSRSLIHQAFSKRVRLLVGHVFRKLIINIMSLESILH
jgi:hypothetical protein